MGTFSFDYSEFLRGTVRAVEDVKKASEKAANAGAKVAASNIAAAAPVRTGGLKDSISVKPAREGKYYDFFAQVFFAGKDEHGERYGEIAAVNEYGKKGQSPKPFVRPALHNSNVYEAMRAAWQDVEVTKA
jgi:HK97 gp10 family phage protein